MDSAPCVSSWGLGNEHDIPIFQVDAAASAVEGRTLMVYDSFYGTNRRRIAPWFRHSVWVHQDDLAEHPELVAELPAFDRVVVARVERWIYAKDVSSLLAPVIVAAQARVGD